MSSKNNRFLNTLKKQFPQISRFIPEKVSIKTFFYKLFFIFLLLGVVFILVLNVTSSLLQPYYLKELLKNPQNLEALAAVLKQNHNPELNQYLQKQLEQISSPKLKELHQQESVRLQQINRLLSLLEKYPQYPDGYAYLAVLYYRSNQCKPAGEKISQALALDPVRPVFQNLQQVISHSCQ
jgi:hypothetical protein